MLWSLKNEFCCHEKINKLEIRVVFLLFPVDCDKFFCHLQSDEFDAKSLFQTNNMVHWNAPYEDILSMWCQDFFVLRDVHSQYINLQEENLLHSLSVIELDAKSLFQTYYVVDWNASYEGILSMWLSVIELSAWLLFISWR